LKVLKRFAVIVSVVFFMISIVPCVSADEGEKININTATVEQLTALKGVGEKYAERIVQFRTENGPFSSPEDIVKVPGIGQKIFEQNKDRITIK